MMESESNLIADAIAATLSNPDYATRCTCAVEDLTEYLSDVLYETSTSFNRDAFLARALGGGENNG